MKERPILMQGNMVRATLDDIKTHTRRIIKSRSKKYPCFNVEERENGWWPVMVDEDGFLPDEGQHDIDCPYGVPGDRLWVRETFCIVNDTEYGGTKWVDYKATPKHEASHPAGWENAPDDPDALKWKPSIHMPRWASRITLEITNVRVERVQDISKEDAKAEGCVKTSDEIGSYSATVQFVELWDSINAKRGFGWSTNPFVWVIEFKVLDKE